MASFKRNRVVNTSLVLREIWTHHEISRVQIARNLDLDKSTITSVVSELLERGLVEETAIGESGPQGGRRPVFLRLNGAKGSVLGIEMKPDGYTAVAVDLTGKILQSWSGDREIFQANLGDTFHEIVRTVRSASTLTAPIQGVGLGVSGVVDSERGVITYSIPLGIAEPWDFNAKVAMRCDLPVCIENDANACAWAELAFNRTRRLRNFLFVLLEFRDTARLPGLHERTALGLGVVIEGRVHHGCSYSAGEFRSVLRGPGNKGQFSLTHAESLRITEDPGLRGRLIEELARNVAMLVTTLNLDEIYLGGDIETYGPSVIAEFERWIQDSWPYPDAVRCRVGFSSLGRRAVAYGAAGLVLNRLFAELGSVGRLGSVQESFPAGVAEQFRSATTEKSEAMFSKDG
ncbi:MAG TPA: ROK family transcriptional regulator [Spirochaetia bacterium]|nr:ROK family transcriptional regulator [Spirochaetia bacterium]